MICGPLQGRTLRMSWKPGPGLKLVFKLRGLLVGIHSFILSEREATRVS